MWWNLKKGRLHALLIGKGLSGNTVGLAYLDQACGNPTKGGGPYSINKAVGSDMNTAETLAHEIGHNFGIEHDFAPGRRGHTCGPGQWGKGGGLMNYGRPLGIELWSKCSGEDFIRYFQRNQPFCLTTSKFIFKFCCIEIFTLINIRLNAPTDLPLSSALCVRV